MVVHRHTRNDFVMVVENVGSVTRIETEVVRGMTDFMVSGGFREVSYRYY